VLVDLEALFAFVASNQLNLCVGEAFGRWPMGRRPPGGI